MAEKTQNIILILGTIIIIVSSLFLIRILAIYKLPYIENKEISSFEYSATRPDWATKETVRENIEILFKKPNYEYAEEKLTNFTGGQCNLITRKITINKGLTLETYAFTLAHELVHLTYFTVNERFCNYTAWKTLYESGNEYFKNIAMAYADADIKSPISEYSFSGYVEKYFSNI